MKFGLWLAVGVLAWLWFGHLRRQQLRSRGQAAPLHQGPADPAMGQNNAQNHAQADARPRAIEAIVACAHCGVHVPASEAVATSAGARFCCDAHRRLHPGA